MHPEQLNGICIAISSAVVPDCGEDSFAARVDAQGGILCIADGCGGAGARRYQRLQNQSEAYWAARLAVEWSCNWAAGLDGARLPRCAEDARLYAERLAEQLHGSLKAFHASYRNEGETHITSSLHRTLPTTLCLAMLDARADDSLACLFLWAGDSRAFVLTPDGLRQCTRDHLHGQANAFDNLYKDAPLSNMVNADHAFTLSSYGARVAKPCVVLTATDGAFAYLPTPMEFEYLLLSTLLSSRDAERWQAKLQRVLVKTASDDVTLLLTCYGFESFEALRAAFAERKAALQRDYITPARRRRQSVEFARTLWDAYRKGYEVDCDADWRL